MYTGRAPFDAVSPLVVLRLHADKPPPAPRELNPRLPVEVEQVLLKALAKKRDERYQSAGELARDLRRATERAQRQLRRPRRQVMPAWAWWAAAGGAIVAVLLGLGLALGSRLFGIGPAPTGAPAGRPTEVAGAFPTEAPTMQPTEVPTAAPTQAPTEPPGETPAETPTEEPAEGPTPEPGATWTRPADEMVMVYVPAGEFEMGSSDDEVDDALKLCSEYLDTCEREWFEQEQPVHTVALDGFWIDWTEVTNGQYRRCVEAGDCSPLGESGSRTRDSYYGDSTYDDYPVIWVTWQRAADYCAWAGARLPTEAEWEYAARGPEGRVFPWGDEFDGTRLNYCDANCPQQWADETVDDGYADTAPVGSYPGGASWCGALDMAGNVSEWLADWYGDYPFGRQVNPTGPSSGTQRVLRGGSWYHGQDIARCAYRLRGPPDLRSDDFGFRCARVSR